MGPQQQQKTAKCPDNIVSPINLPRIGGLDISTNQKREPVSESFGLNDKKLHKLKLFSYYILPSLYVSYTVTYLFIGKWMHKN